MEKRQIKVTNFPPTWIETDSPLSDEAIKKQWEEKFGSYDLYRPRISKEQKRREYETIRGGKLFQRTKFKK